jgi:hypothetical protein
MHNAACSVCHISHPVTPSTPNLTPTAAGYELPCPTPGCKGVAVSPKHWRPDRGHVDTVTIDVAGNWGRSR